MRQKPQFYAISAAFEKIVPRSRNGGTGTVSVLDWRVYAGPCDSIPEAHEHGRAALPEMSATDTVAETLHKNFKVVAKSRLRKFGINVNAQESDPYLDESIFE